MSCGPGAWKSNAQTDRLAFMLHHMSQLTKEQVKVLGDKHFAYLATINPDGSPHVTPVWVDTDGEAVIMNTTIGGLKERNLRRDLRVMIAIVDPAAPYTPVLIKGRAELIEEGAKGVIDGLAKKYIGADEYPWLQPGERRVTIRVVPDSGKRQSSA
jgi:PPOX class probable F420-dependent enzyme